MEIATEDVVVIGIAATDEVRCFAVIGDPRLFHSGWFGPVPDRKDFLKTVTDFDLPFCQDPSITKVRMFRSKYDARVPSLVEVGSFALAPRSLPTKHRLQIGRPPRALVGRREVTRHSDRSEAKWRNLLFVCHCPQRMLKSHCVERAGLWSRCNAA